VKAIINGCGVAGPVTAMALQKVGISSTVYERRDPAAHGGGLFLTLAANGIRVLEDLGIADCLSNVDVISTPMMSFYSSRGRRLGCLSLGRLESGSTPVTLMRDTLNRALAQEAARCGVDIRYGCEITRMRQDDGTVSIETQEGSHDRADFLIGADGIHSLTRDALHRSRTRPAYAGLVNVGGIVTATNLSPTPGEVRMIWGKQAFFGYTVRPNGEAWWFANVGCRAEPPRSKIGEAGAAAWRARLLEIFRGDLPIIPELISSSDSVAAYPIHDVPRVPRWFDRRVVLLGDAAHAVSPSAGQGASLALEDALALAECLRAARNVEDAFSKFEAMRRPRAERMVAEGRRRSRHKAPTNRVTRLLRDSVMSLVFQRFATERSMSWIHDYRVPILAPSTRFPVGGDPFVSTSNRRDL
jgi:FAD-dependent urate hydroxylase